MIGKLANLHRGQLALTAKDTVNERGINAEQSREVTGFFAAFCEHESQQLRATCPADRALRVLPFS